MPTVLHAIPGARALARCAGLAFALSAGPAAGQNEAHVHFVSPEGKAGGPGGRDRPWSLAWALGGADGLVQPGDTVWLERGTYRGAFRTGLVGLPDRPIVFRQLPGARATIDGTLRADGEWLVFWGFEIMQSDPLHGTYGLQANTAHGRFINLIIHDAGTQGVSFWTPAVDAELYGCIIYNNGTHENFDHGVYAHNETGTKRLEDNVFFNNYARGIQVYASPANPGLRDFRIVGNVAFDNGLIAARSSPVNLLVNSTRPMSGIVVEGNFLYYASDTAGINLRLGVLDTSANRDIAVRANYAGGGKIGLEMPLRWARATVSGNTLIGSRAVVRTGGDGLGDAYTWSRNGYVRDPAARGWSHGDQRLSFRDWRAASGLGAEDSASVAPPATRVFVRPNRYEPGRATIVAYNWSRDATVTAELGEVLQAGDSFEVRNVQDFFGAPVVAGVYRGGALTIPMQGVSPPVPIGRATPGAAPRTGPRFDVFVVQRAPRSSEANRNSR